MNRELLDKIVRAVLYEGYILYPYRPSIKNAQRWTFGGIYAQQWCREKANGDAWVMQTQCLLEERQSAASPRVSVSVSGRFLQLIQRQVARLHVPQDELHPDEMPAHEPVMSLEIAGETWQTWQEAAEREIDLGQFLLTDLLACPRRRMFAYPRSREVEPIRSPDGMIGSMLIRRSESIEGCIEVSAERLHEGVCRLTVKIENQSVLNDGASAGRDDALLQSLASTHTLLGVTDAAFVSQIDPPEMWRQASQQCRNIGAFPVLVGEAGERDTMLSAPIILYDYPQIAPESPGDLFDGTEIDEILTLRILTLTDDEKRMAAAVDRRARDLLARSHELGPKQMAGLHGAMRGLRPVHDREQGDNGDDHE